MALAFFPFCTDRPIFNAALAFSGKIKFHGAVSGVNFWTPNVVIEKKVYGHGDVCEFLFGVRGCLIGSRYNKKK